MKEALDVLRTSDPQQLGPQGLLLRLELELYAGDVTVARELLNQLTQPGMDPQQGTPQPPPQLPPQLQPQFRHLTIQVAAAVGNYGLADGELTAAEGQLARPVEEAAGLQVRAFGQTLAVPRVPLAAAVTNRIASAVAAQTGFPLYRLGQYRLWHGMLAVEAGNLPLARRQFGLARMYELSQMYGQYWGRQ